MSHFGYESAAKARVRFGVKLPERFWQETCPRVTDVTLAALLQSLLHSPDTLPVGVINVATTAFEATRFAWAATQIAGELAIAPGLTVDSLSGLAVVWEVALAELPRGPYAAAYWGRRIADTQASWARELAKRLGSKMEPVTRAPFEKSLRESGWPKFKVTPMKPRRRVDGFEAELQLAKRTEHLLRSEFQDADDLGERPSPADRRAFVAILSAGFSVEQTLDALRGRADKCRRHRRWKDLDTAQVFLRLTWLCADVRRFVDAEQVGASLRQDPSGIVTGPAGNFAHGLEICTE